jgi:negative regulator of replication initiation
LDAEIAAVERMGVEIRVNSPIEGEGGIDRLFEDGYGAVFVGIGAHRGLRLNIPGEGDYPEVKDCVTFLREINLGEVEELSGRVVTIGGGFSAIDCARVALRVGAEESHVVYRRTQVEMPAPAEDAPKKGKTSVQPGQKPVSFTLLGETFPASTWREVLVTTCAALARRHPDDFAAIATTVKGRKRQYIAPAPDGMINPAPIPGTDLWVETNQSAKSVVRLVEKLLAAFGYSPDDFAVHMDTAAAETASYAESRL